MGILLVPILLIVGSVGRWVGGKLGSSVIGVLGAACLFVLALPFTATADCEIYLGENRWKIHCNAVRAA